MKKSKTILYMAIIVLVISFYNADVDTVSVEEAAVASAFGIDIEKDAEDNIQYKVTYEIYNYGKMKTYSTTNIVSSADIVGNNRQERQLKMDKTYKVDANITIFSEEAARHGIDNLIDIFFANPKMNDRGLIVVSKQNSNEILNYKAQGYPSAAEYIQDMIKNSTVRRLVNKNYRVLNTYIIRNNEGKTLVIPYIELTPEGLKLTGMAIFDGEKMDYSIGIEESKVMNLMRENNIRGSFSIKKSSKKYLDYSINSSKRKIKVYKDKEGILNFEIAVKLKGDIKNDTLYEDKEQETIKNMEEDLEKQINKDCEEFIKNMQNKYKLDLLNLGSIAAAKYGREKTIDWNEEISKAKINVKVDAKIDKVGRGQY